MSFLERLLQNMADVRHFGPGILRRHVPPRATLQNLHLRVGARVKPIRLRRTDSDLITLRQAFISGIYDFSWPQLLNRRVMSAYRDILAGGDTPIILDAGANIGAAALWFAWRFPEAHIVAVEPDPANATILRDNLAGQPRTVVLEAAIGAERGHVSLEAGEASWAVRTHRSSSGVPVVTVDDAFRASGGRTPFLAKIDIEGFEKDLFASNTAWVDRCYAIFIEPHDWMLPGELSSRNFQTEMARHPFELFIRGDNLLYVRL